MGEGHFTSGEAKLFSEKSSSYLLMEIGVKQLLLSNIYESKICSESMKSKIKSQMGCRIETIEHQKI